MIGDSFELRLSSVKAPASIAQKFEVPRRNKDAGVAGYRVIVAWAYMKSAAIGGAIRRPQTMPLQRLGRSEAPVKFFVPGFAA